MCSKCKRKCKCKPISIPKGEKGDPGSGSGVSLVEITYDDLSSLKSSDDLVIGTDYKIIDRGDQGIIVKAISKNNLSVNGKRIMNCPIDYTGGNDINGITIFGVFKKNTIYSNCLVIWGGLYWQITGTSTGSDPVSFNELDSEWTLIPKPSYGNTNSYYIEMPFEVEYDFDNDWISLQSDDNGNVFGIAYGEFPEGVLNPDGDINPVDISDWNLSSAGFRFFGNKNVGIFNNYGCDTYNNDTKYSIYMNNCASIAYNTNLGDLSENMCNDLNANSNKGEIFLNNCNSIISNSHGGSIFECEISGDIMYNDFHNNQYESISSIISPVISVRNNRAITNSGIAPGGVYEMDITGLTIITFLLPNSSNIGYLIDRVLLTSSNATESITSFHNSISTCYYPIFFDIDSSLEVTFVHGAGSLQPKCEGGIDAVLQGANGDFIEFSRRPNLIRQTNIGTY